MHESSKHPSLREFTSAPGGAISSQSARLFQLRGQHAQGKVQLPHHIHYACNRCKLYRSFAANESNLLHALLVNLFEPGSKPIPGDGLLVNFERSVRQHLNDDNEFRMTLYRPRLRGLRQLRIQPGLVMRNDHKDHQQHQQNINQRNDIRLRRNATLTTNQHSHESPRKKICLREDSHILRTSKTETTGLPRAWR